MPPLSSGASPGNAARRTVLVAAAAISVTLTAII
jgi:hypothetical protein